MTDLLERWLPIIGYEDAYEVSDFGQVRGLDRICWNGHGEYLYRGRLLRPEVKRKRHVVLLSKDGHRRMLSVGVLVATAFVGPCPPGLECCHGAAGSLDDSLANVSWGTHEKNNGPDKVRDGTSNRGERCARAKLTAADVLEIRRLRQLGVPRAKLASQFSVSLSCIGSIISKHSWAWL